MSLFKYYKYENGHYTLINQKTRFLITSVILILAAVSAFFPNPNSILYFGKYSIIGSIVLILLASFNFLRTTKKIHINPKAGYVSRQQFYFSKPELLYFKDFDMLHILHLTSFGIKTTSIVDMRFNINNIEQRINLRETLLSTKSLQEIVDETQQIMKLI